MHYDKAPTAKGCLECKPTQCQSRANSGKCPEWYLLQFWCIKGAPRHCIVSIFHLSIISARAWLPIAIDAVPDAAEDACSRPCVGFHVIAHERLIKKCQSSSLKKSHRVPESSSPSLDVSKRKYSGRCGALLRPASEMLLRGLAR